MNYKVYSDGASRGNPGPAGAGFIVYDSNGIEVHKSSIPLGITTNNVAEYTALLEAICYMLSLKPLKVDFYMDSELIVKQISGVYRVKAEHLIPIYVKVKDGLGKLNYTCSHIPRAMNKEADALANEGAELSAK